MKTRLEHIKTTQTWITSSDFGQVVLLGQALQLGKQSNIVICTNIKYCENPLLKQSWMLQTRL